MTNDIYTPQILSNNKWLQDIKATRQTANLLLILGATYI